MQDDFGNALGPHVVRTIGARLDAGDKRMQRIEGDMAALRGDLQANTAATQAVADGTAELVAAYHAAQGAIKVLNWIAKIAKPMVTIVSLAVALAGLWQAIKTGVGRA